MEVELAYAEADRQFLRRFSVPQGACVADAIRTSGIEGALGIDATRLDAGIWSRPVARDVPLREGDRVELYRPLKADPKESRRRRAERNAARRQP
ncbi:MAG: RnfH family protein [Lysobacteraceae bacterium]|nr:MAG: RnfH family protein [Xanthomonadaceae bacterium]